LWVHAQDTTTSLPAMRSLAALPVVRETGVIPGASMGFPVTPVFALADLQTYAKQLESAVPWTGKSYSADSVERIKRSRAVAWLGRLRDSGTAPYRSTSGWQLVAMAQIAVKAHEDTLAHHLFDTRLAQLPASPAERSYVLLQAIVAFSDPMLDSSRLAHTLAWANTYDVQLQAMSHVLRPGVQSRNDSTSILYHRVDAERALLLGYGAIGEGSETVRHLGLLWMALGSIASSEQSAWLEYFFPYLDVFHAIATGANGTSNIAALNARLAALNALQPDRTMVARIGQIAPPIQVHAILNTADSVYRAEPHSIPLNNGSIYVVRFGDADHDLATELQYVRAHVPANVNVVLVTRTSGHANEDLVTPDQEVAWLKDLYENQRHITFPIAIWAPAKVFVEPGMLPPGPSTDSTYIRNSNNVCVVIDGHDVIRDYYDLTSPTSQRALLGRLATLAVERTPSAAPLAH